MKIIILEIYNLFVKFRSELGEGFAKWRDGIPKIEHTYEVELDVDEEMIWGLNLDKSPNSIPMIKGDMSIFECVAEVISYEIDGCLSINIGGSIILLETKGVPSNINGYIKFKTQHLILYPVNI